MINQSATSSDRTKGLNSLLAGIYGEVANKRLDWRDGGDCNQLGLYIDWHCCQIDRDQLGLCINGCQRWFQQWVWRWVRQSVPLGCAGLLTSVKRLTAQMSGFYSYQPRGLNGLVLWNEIVVLQTRFTGFVKWTHRFTGSFKGSLNASFNGSFNGYYNSDVTLLQRG